MLALAEYRASRCGGCGGDLTETTRPDSDGAYRVPPPTRCHCCTAVAVAVEGYRDSPQPQALMFLPERRRRE